jgi:pimeloyl-ACP methyl ester carboxylesterase
MREFQKVLAELKNTVASHKPGQLLTPPEILPSVTINGRRVSYATMGLDNPASGPDAKPAVILLHGFGGFFMDWPRVMAPLSRHTRVYAIDLPGWGFSELNPDGRSLEDDVGVVDQFIKMMKLERVILCGLSYGAGVTWAAASMNISRIKRAVLINPMPPHPIKWITSPIYQGIFALNKSRAAAFLGHKMLRKSHYKMICRENLLNERLLDSFYLDLAYLVMKQPKMPLILNAHAKGAEEVDWNDWEHKLAGCRVPVSILQGQNDRIFSMDSAWHLHELIPHSELIEVADCGHAMVFDQPKRVAEFLVQQLSREEEKRIHVSSKAE